MTIRIFPDDNFGPRVWRAIVLRHGRYYCWTTTQKPDERMVRKEWRTHGRAKFLLWDNEHGHYVHPERGVL